MKFEAHHWRVTAVAFCSDGKLPALSEDEIVRPRDGRRER